MSSWMSGQVVLPPRGIKDAEIVGECCQLFIVGDCQDNSGSLIVNKFIPFVVELGLANPKEDVWVDEIAQRILLKKGDSFYVPPGNIYRLENHSHEKSCLIYYTIIRPIDEPELSSQNASGEELITSNNSSDIQYRSEESVN